MTTFNDIFKQKFLNNFINNISISTVGITLITAAILSLIVFFTYKLTTRNMVYSKKFNVTMALMSIVTSAVVLSMQANIVVSLGMVGALSIVRFRTAIKEPRDLLFLFWSISNGIIVGANLYSIAFMLSAVLIVGMLFFDLLPIKSLPCLLVINCKNFKSEQEVLKLLKKQKVNFNIKSRNVSGEKIDLLLEVSIKMENKILESISKIKDVQNVNLISQDGESQY